VSNKENNNRRVLVGAVIFALLIGMNLIVRYRRTSSQSSSALPLAPTTLVSPATTSPARATASLPKPATNTENITTDLPVSSPEVKDTNFLVPGSELQMLAINQRLEELRQKLQIIEKPYTQPDLNIDLLLSSYDRFRWKQPVTVATETAVIEPEPVIASAAISREVEILGVFRIKGQNKLMIRENSKVYLVNEGEETRPENIIVQKTATSSYLVFDSGGSTHDLQLKKPAMDGVGKAIAILRGQDDQQPSFEVQTREIGTETERIFPTK